LISFVGVLWGLSKSVVFSYKGTEFAIPGYMVWSALFYAGTASWLSWLFGRRLIAYNGQRYAREADLRVAMVRVNQHVDAVTLYGGEADERRRLDAPLNNVLGAMRRLVSALARLTWVTSGYGWFALVAPIIVAAPAYFSGKLTFGALMMAVGAFNQVQQALRWFVDNFAVIADWQATLFRVVSFRQALLRMDEAPPTKGEEQILRELSGNDTLSFSDLQIDCNSHRAALNKPEITLRPGDHVLIAGEQGVGKTSLFRAIAGLWEIGRGTIRLPPRSEIMFMPTLPYLPPGTLRETLLYLAQEPAHDDKLRAALLRVKLDNLAGNLDRYGEWDRELPHDEQQRLAFARAFIQKPRWIIIDEAIEQIDIRYRNDVVSMFEDELNDSAIVNITTHAEHQDFYDRKYRLERVTQEAEEPAAVA
jgi:putative ATP-binding cassette transporter